MTIHVFRAGPNGTTPQSSIVNSSYTPVTLYTSFSYEGATGFDSGGEYTSSNNTWTPQAGPIQWSAQFWVANFGGGVDQNLVVSMFKNGVDWQAGLGGSPVATFPGTGIVQHHGADIASGTDQYQLRVWITTSSGANNGQVSADPRHNWWNGISFGSGG